MNELPRCIKCGRQPLVDVVKIFGKPGNRRYYCPACADDYRPTHIRESYEYTDARGIEFHILVTQDPMIQTQLSPGGIA